MNPRYTDPTVRSSQENCSQIRDYRKRSLHIDATGEKDPPTFSREGAAQMWASAVQGAVQKMEKKEVTLKTTSGVPQGLHIGYEEDFLQCRPSQVP